MYKVYKVGPSTSHQDDFLALPRTLYAKNRLTQDIAAEQALIAGTHPLSANFSFTAYVVYRDKHPVARYALTHYPNNALYIGFFECEQNNKTAAYLFAAADKIAKKLGANSIVGPVDASFWIKYRLKTNRFDKRPYVAEPYNHEYYKEFFVTNGYAVRDHYVSTLYNSFLPKKRYKEFSDKHREFVHKDYQIIGIDKENFDTSMRHIYTMVMNLYADFPIFHHIEFDVFKALFAPMKYISVPQFSKIAYHNGRPAGFLFTLPDYQNLLYDLSALNKLRVGLRRIRAPRYVMLYMGVLPEHHGLARALIKSTLPNLYLRLSPLIGALIHDGKPTRSYAEESIKDTFEYELFEKKL